MLRDAFQAIESIPGGWEALIPEPGAGGFMYSSPAPGSIRHRINQAINATPSGQGHSGSSYGWTMRQMQAIARFGWEQYVQLVRNAQAHYAQPAVPPQQAPNLFDETARTSAMNGNSPGCAICMENLENNVYVIDDGTVADGPVKCGHKFHKACIEGWVRNKANPTCPMCRGRISKIHPASVVGGGRRRRNLRKTRKTRKTRKSSKSRKTRLRKN